MRLAHLADAHLGYRAYNKVNRLGINAREADVFDTFRQALRKVLEIKADLVLIAGDLFHSVRPSNLTIHFAFRELLAFRTQSEAPVVIVGGNHDSPRSADSGCILDLLANVPGVSVAHAECAQIRLPQLATSVFCLCHNALQGLGDIRIVPDPESRYNILLAHGRVEGIEKGFDRYEITSSDVRLDEWDYVAYGHLHSMTQVAPNAFYSGSLEYAGGLSIWEQHEQDPHKGFIEYDLDDRRVVAFHSVQPRDVVDLRPIDADGLLAAEVNAMVARRLASIPGGPEGKIVRLILQNIDRSVQSELDYVALRQVRADAVHFELQMIPPALHGRRGLSESHAARPLELEWEEFSRQCELPAGVDRDRLLELGRQYLIDSSPGDQTCG